MGQFIKYTFMGVFNVILVAITLAFIAISITSFYIAMAEFGLGLLMMIALYIIGIIFSILSFIMFAIIGYCIKNAF